MDLERARANMVEQQIRTWEVLDQDVLDLLYVVPREEFVPPQHRALAFSDLEIPIGEGERMWQPKLEAQRAAQVVSVESSSALAAFGRGNLERHGVDDVLLEIGDASHGWARHAP